MIEKDYTKRLLLNDCTEILAMLLNVNEPDRAVFSLAAMPYISLVANEVLE